jgi:FkbM family methyltransferase
MKNLLLERKIQSLMEGGEASVRTQMAQSYLERAHPKHSHIVVVGGGPLGRAVLRGLESLALPVLCVADNNLALQGTKVRGIPVYSFEEAITRYGNEATFVVAVYNQSRPYHQLKNFGCPYIVSYASLFAQYPTAFLPHACLEDPSKVFADREIVLASLDLWADERSQIEYLHQIERRLYQGFEPPRAAQSIEMRSSEYFPPLYTHHSQEVLADCGAFTGDTIGRFLSLWNDRFAKIIGLEPDPDNFIELGRYVASLEDSVQKRISLHQVAVGRTQETLRFCATSSPASSLSDVGSFEVQAIPLDSFLADVPPTLVKMDVEGAELEALAGAEQLIRRGQTVFAVTVYHCSDHLWRIPNLIRGWNDSYRFFLQAHAEDCWDVSCYAVPADRCL